MDALGLPLELAVTEGQAHDMSQAFALVAAFPQAKQVIADKGYDSKALVQLIQQQGATAVIPSRSNAKQPRDYDHHLYKERHLVECLFNKMKHFRRIATRFDKLAKRFMSFLQFTAALLWLR